MEAALREKFTEHAAQLIALDLLAASHTDPDGTRH